MSHLDEFAARLQESIGGQTLASLRDEATSELAKLGDMDAARAERFGDWKSVSLAEVVARAMMRGGFCYDFDSSSRSTRPPVALIAAAPDSITRLESVLGLQP